jgi:hypothetical protein
MVCASEGLHRGAAHFELADARPTQVVARGDAGDNVLQFKMKMTTAFGKMITRWCDHHGVQQDQASCPLDEVNDCGGCSFCRLVVRAVEVVAVTIVC